MSSEKGSDGLSLLENLAPRGDSPPLHVHHTEDEIFHILEGEFRFRVGDEELRVGAGETLLAPKGVPIANVRQVTAPIRTFQHRLVPRGYLGSAAGAGRDGFVPATGRAVGSRRVLS